MVYKILIVDFMNIFFENKHLVEHSFSKMKKNFIKKMALVIFISNYKLTFALNPVIF